MKMFCLFCRLIFALNTTIITHKQIHPIHSLVQLYIELIRLNAILVYLIDDLETVEIGRTKK